MHVRHYFSYAAAALLAATACSKSEAPPAVATDSAATATAPAACPANAEITLPTGFCATIFSDSVKKGRHIAVAANGDVYITVDGTAGAEGPKPAGPAVSFVALRDTNKDGVADMLTRVGTRGNTGIGLHNGYLYVDEGTRIVRYARPDTQLVPTASAEVILDGMPLNPGHRARNFAIGADGVLYVNIGSATNSCQTVDRKNESLGVDPCTELNTRAGIWKYDASKTGQRFSAKERFATGIRNGMGMAVGPAGALYATQHGRDQLHDNWPRLFPTTAYQAENPGEVLLQVNQNDDFGWPYCYYGVEAKKLITAPEYGGDGTKDDRCTDKKAAVAAFPGHWAPMSLLFYNGSTFPAKYKDGAFIAFHGSWNRAPETQAGYNVVFQPLANGAAGGAYEVFADGFSQTSGPALQPGSAKHRPMGLATGPDGALYITDDAGGRVYRVTYGTK